MYLLRYHHGVRLMDAVLEIIIGFLIGAIVSGFILYKFVYPADKVYTEMNARVAELERRFELYRLRTDAILELNRKELNNIHMSTDWLDEDIEMIEVSDDEE